MKYHISIRTLHWIIAIIVIGMLITVNFQSILPKEIKKEYFYWHKSFGALLLILVFVRIFFRLTTTIPPYPDNFSKHEKLLAKAAIYTFYILLIAMPLSGYIMSNAAGYPVSLFGYELPMLIAEKNKPLKKLANEVHELIGNGLIILISLHILAVVKHYVIDKQNILKRIW